MLNENETLKPTVLIIDDDNAMRTLLLTILKGTCQVLTANSAAAGIAAFKKNDVDIVLLDVMLGDDNGINVLKRIKEERDRTEVIVITVVKDIRTAVEAMKNGAYDYINKDFDYDEVQLLVKKAHEKIRLSSELQALRNEIKKYTDDDSYVSALNPKIRELELLMARIAKMPSNVLIMGESGTGKEIIARRIHNLACKDTMPPFPPFVSVNLASIPDDLIESTLFGHEKGSFTGAMRTHKGKFELANGGTLFLDEIGELKLELQSKILRAIQEREIERVGSEDQIPVNVRLIAATNRNLLEGVKNGTFREDLYYRLNVIPMNLTPLRERLEDLPDFLNHFLKKYSERLGKKVTGVTSEVMDCFTLYQWPGNIRELENIIERMVALAEADTLTLDDVPLELRFSYQATSQPNFDLNELLNSATQAFERRFILSALNRNAWNQVKTAQELGVHRKTLEYKLKQLNMQKLVEERRKTRNKLSA